MPTIAMLKIYVLYQFDRERYVEYHTYYIHTYTSLNMVVKYHKTCMICHVPMLLIKHILHTYHRDGRSALPSYLRWSWPASEILSAQPHTLG